MVCENRRIRHATHSLLPFGPSTQLEFFPPRPSLLCWLGCHRPPTRVGYPPSVGFSVSRWWGGSPGGLLPASPMNQAYFPNVALRLPLVREVTPCFWVSVPKDLSGTHCVEKQILKHKFRLNHNRSKVK